MIERPVSTAAAQHDTRFFGHPRGLANLFGIEMWERFSFYGMQGVLLYYLYYEAEQGGLGISQATATSIAGAYSGTVYLSTVIAAWVADRLLGPEKTLLSSAALVMAGHVWLSVVPGLIGVSGGLNLIALGSGGVKANATRLVGDLYTEKDPRRDGGFTLFYMGVNTGAFLGPLLTGFIKDEAGFHWAFGLAAAGMALGLIQYVIFRKHVAGAGAVPIRPLPPHERMRWVAMSVAAVVTIAVVVGCGWVTASTLSDVVVGLVTAASVAYFAVILSNRHITRVERLRVVGFIPLFLASVAFWSLYQQQFTTIAVYADKRLNRKLFGWEFPASWVQSINPVFIILLATVLLPPGANSVVANRLR